MKTTLFIFCLILSNLCYSQIDYSEHWVNSGWEYSRDDDSIIDVSEKIITKKDLTYLLKGTYPSYTPSEKEIIPLYGLLGSDFNKIEFVFTKIEKNDHNSAQYLIKGKTRFNNNINTFKGNITFEKAIAYISKTKEQQTVIVLTGSYKLIEDSNTKTAGTYIGKLKMILFTKNIHANNVLFDMDMFYEDGAIRAFVGVRKSNKNSNLQSCIWGFLRFPHEYAKYFDIGAGEEKINIKYAKPWFNYTELEWSEIIKSEINGIFTHEKEYIVPEAVTWY